MYLKNSPPPLIQKIKNTKACVSGSPKPLLIAFLLSFLVFLFTPTSKYSILDVLSFPLVYFFSSFGAPNCENVIIFLGQFWVVFMLDFLELRI